MALVMKKRRNKIEVKRKYGLPSLSESGFKVQTLTEREKRLNLCGFLCFTFCSSAPSLEEAEKNGAFKTKTVADNKLSLLQTVVPYWNIMQTFSLKCNRKMKGSIWRISIYLPLLYDCIAHRSTVLSFCTRGYSLALLHQTDIEFHSALHGFQPDPFIITVNRRSLFTRQIHSRKTVYMV